MRFPGFIDLDVFNEVNKQKFKVVINGDSVEIKTADEMNKMKRTRRTRHNKDYPFKNVICCPKCGKTLKGSAPKGGSGTTYPQYHCHIGHSSWYVPRDEFNKNIIKYLKEIEFDESTQKLQEAMFYEEYDNKRSQVIDESIKAEQQLTNLKIEQKNVLTQIKKDIVRYGSPGIRSRF